MRAILGTLFFIFIVNGVAYGQSEPSNKILAIVNDEVITQNDLDAAFKSVVAEYREQFSGQELADKIEEARREFLNQIIEDKLILQEAKRRGVVVEDSDVDERLKEIKLRFSSDEEFEAVVAESGVTLDILKKRYRDQIMMTKLVTHEIKDKVSVTPAEISEYYQQHLEELKTPDAARVRVIMIRFDAATTENLARQKAQDVCRLIEEGRDFADLAKQYSQGPKAEEGGDFGFLDKGQMRPEFDEAIFTLEPGEVSDPIKADTGYYIFKVEERRDGHLMTLEEARDKVESILFRDKAENRYKEWIAKLKKDAFIQIK